MTTRQAIEGSILIFLAGLTVALASMELVRRLERIRAESKDRRICYPDTNAAGEIVGNRARSCPVGAGNMAIASGTGDTREFKRDSLYTFVVGSDPAGGMTGIILFVSTGSQVLGCYYTTAGDTTMRLAIGGEDMGPITQPECDTLGRIINRVKARRSGGWR